MAVTPITDLGAGGVPAAATPGLDAKTLSNASAEALLVEEFQVWREDYAGAKVQVLRAGTTTPAQLYSDVNLTKPKSNPQTLQRKTDRDGRSYGKFETPVYTDTAYYLRIDGVEQTGVVRKPLTSLKGEDASDATVTADHGSWPRTLAERAAYGIHALDFGRLEQNQPKLTTATIVDAVGSAAANGGGVVILPPGQFQILSLSVPKGVVIQGQGIGATTLASQEATRVVTFTAVDAGLADLTLDGVNLVPNGVGLWWRDVDRVRLSRVLVRRFDTAVEARGGRSPIFRDAFFQNCNYGPRLFGDSDQSAGGFGAAFEAMDWVGGGITQMTRTAFELSVVDRAVRHADIRKVDIHDNIGPEAVLLYGASHTEFTDCRWWGNTTNLNVRDNPDETLDVGKVRGVNLYGGEIDGGEVAFDGRCQDVRLERMRLKDVDWKLNVPANPILVKDCEEGGGTLSGATTKLARFYGNQQGYTVGTTTAGAAVIIWAEKVTSGHLAIIRVSATAKQTNGTEYAAFVVEQAARCAPASLDFDGQTTNFTVGNTVRGETSGATGIIAGQTDSGSSGTLTLISPEGTFIDDEKLEEVDANGDGRVNGVLTPGSVSLIGSKVSHISQLSNAQGWSVDFTASGREMQVTVTGASDDDVDWRAKVEVAG